VTDEQKNKDKTKEPQEEKAPPKKNGLIKYILFGVIGIVVVAGVAFATLLILGGDHPHSAQEETAEKATEAPAQHDNPNIAESLAIEGLDQNATDLISENLAMFDYEPDASEIESEAFGMSVGDSIQAANWLKQEKATLSKKEKELDSREKELQRLDKQVSQKILRIEQVESARITSLAKLYDSMDSRAVAKLMANLDDKTVVSILPRMKIKNASAVLQLLPPRRAAKLSKQMITIAEK